MQVRSLGVIVNVFFPGLGTILVGKVVTGVVQFLLSGLALTLTATGVGAVVGIPLGVAVWIWGIVSAATTDDRPLFLPIRDNVQNGRG